MRCHQGVIASNREDLHSITLDPYRTSASKSQILAIGEVALEQ
jgi:hypothetical protein